MGEQPESPTARDMAALAHGFALLADLRNSDLDQNLIWLLPDHLLVGFTELYGVAVSRAGYPFPMLAHAIPRAEGA